MQEEELRRLKESLPLETHSVTKTEEIKVRAYCPVRVLIILKSFRPSNRSSHCPHQSIV